MTEGYFYGIIGAIASVFFVNYVFTYPYMQLDFTLSGYPLTFITMMIVAGVTSTMTSRLKESEQIKAEAAAKVKTEFLANCCVHTVVNCILHYNLKCFFCILVGINAD